MNTTEAAEPLGLGSTEGLGDFRARFEVWQRACGYGHSLATSPDGRYADSRTQFIYDCCRIGGRAADECGMPQWVLSGEGAPPAKKTPNVEVTGKPPRGAAGAR